MRVVDDPGGVVGHGAGYARIERDGWTVRLETNGDGKVVEVREQQYTRTSIFGISAESARQARAHVDQLKATTVCDIPLGERVVRVHGHLLEFGPATTKSIADQMGIPRRMVSESLQCLKRRGEAEYTESSDEHRSRVCIWSLRDGKQPLKRWEPAVPYRKTWTDADTERMLEMRANGSTMKLIADELKRGQRTISQQLRLEGIE